MKFHVFWDEHDWRLLVPSRLLMGYEHGTYRRRTFAEILKLMDFFIGRARVRGPYEVAR